MSLRDRLNVRPRSRAFIEARTQRLLLDTLYKYGHHCVLSDHAVELIREEIEQGRSGDPISASIPASIDTTTAEVSCYYVDHQSWLLSLFFTQPTRAPQRSAPRGRMELISLHDHRRAFRPEFRICSPIGPLTWGGVFVTFAFPPRGTPQPRSPKGLTRWGTDARLCPYFGEFKTEMYHFFIHVCSEPKFTW